MRVLVILSMLSLLGGCVAPEIRSDFDAGYSFAGLKTWAWLEPVRVVTSDELGAADLASKRIHRAVDAQMQAKGFVLAKEGERPDFFVVSHAAVQHRIDNQYISETYGYGYGRWGGAAYERTLSYAYDEGSLVIDVLEPTGKEVVWRGSARSAIDLNVTAEQRTTRINDAVAKVLADFPPKGGS